MHEIQLGEVIDKIYCINLSRCAERREHIDSHFSDFGIHEYSYFKATDKDDPLVEEYFNSEKVMRFPPCFRCGKNSCRRKDCNNTLIAPQVAVFITFLRLWEDIVKNNIGVALIVEDDVCFTNYATEIVPKIFSKDTFSKLKIEPTNPALLRLGWALNREHQYSGRMEIERGKSRMANSCHVITLEMARLLLKSFDKINTTVDIYIHDRIGKDVVDNYTVFPPIAYDISNSTGSLQSEIHPKKIRVKYLKNDTSVNAIAIQESEKILKNHIKHTMYRSILVIGHPRCGSKYMSALLKAYGLNVGHEYMTADGISSWMFMVNDRENPYALNRDARSREGCYFENVIHCIRNPREAIPSIIRENDYARPSYEFRRKHIMKAFNVDLNHYQNKLERAAYSFIYWNKLAENQKVDLVVKVEECEQEVFDFLSNRKLFGKMKFDWNIKRMILRYLLHTNVIASNSTLINLPFKDVNSNKAYQGVVREKNTVTQDEWDNIECNLKYMLNSFCDKYGYEKIFK